MKKAKDALDEALKSDTGGSFWENSNSEIQYENGSGEEETEVTS